MRVLALDLAARTGWAVADKGVIVDSGEWLLEGDRPERFVSMASRIDTLLQMYRPRYVIYERPFTRGAGSRVLWGYAAVAEQCAHRHGIASIDELPATLKAWATGSGKASKDAMIREAVLRTSRDIAGPDEADAILLALYASEKVREAA